MIKAPLSLKPADYQRTCYFVTVPDGLPLATVMSSDFWVHVRNRMRLYDLFEVIAEDGTYEAEIRLVSINQVNGVLKFRLLSLWEPEKAEDAITPKVTAAGKYKAAWNVGKRAFVVQEVSTGAVVAEGFTSKREADDEVAKLDAMKAAA